MQINTNKTLLIVFVSSLLVYLLSCFGVFDELSEYGATLLYNALGYTNKWSHTYGPQWFVVMNKNISALGSRELVFIFSTILYFYLRLNRGTSLANKFGFTVGFGIFFILITKALTSKNEDVSIDSFLIENLSNFPSGHTYIATVLYFSIAQIFASKNTSDFVNKYLFVSASILISIVGLSRYLGSGHTITEVIAGWSLGLCWFTFAQMFLGANQKTFSSQQSA